jgi:hypothetical protein
VSETIQRDFTMQTEPKLLKIIRCSDSLMWYSKHVGQEFPLLREYDDCYMSREPEGFANIVRKEDAVILKD